MTLLLTYFTDLKSLEPFYYFIFWYKKVINELTCLIVIANCQVQYVEVDIHTASGIFGEHYFCCLASSVRKNTIFLFQKHITEMCLW